MKTQDTGRAVIFWQSQSGNTYAAALKAKEGLGSCGISTELHHILSKELPDMSAGLFVFAFPIYNFKPATAMSDFIEALPVFPERRKAVALFTCTGLAVNTSILLKRKLAKKNIDLVSALKVRGAETYILLRKYMKATLKFDNRPDDAQLDKVKQYFEAAAKKGFPRQIFLFNPFSIWHWLGAISPAFGPGRMFSERAWAKGSCTLCGHCYSLCPSGSIRREGNELKVEVNTCVGCCGCFNICLKKAWSVSGFEQKYFLENRLTPVLLKAVKKK